MHPSILVDDDINHKKNSVLFERMTKIMTHFIIGEI